jgi:ABC-2 type transport system permease protein
MIFFPLVFLSNVFVPQGTLPRWLQAWVDISPVAHLATATRALMNGSVDAVSLVVVLGTAATLTLVFLPLTTWLYGRT